MIRALKEKMAASMGMKLVAAVTGVIFVLMLLGTIFVARMLMESQYRGIETRGRELGVFLGKAGTDPILYKDIITLEDIYAAGVEIALGKDIGTELRYQYREYNDKVDSANDGTTQIVLATMSVKW